MSNCNWINGCTDNCLLMEWTESIECLWLWYCCCDWLFGNYTELAIPVNLVIVLTMLLERQTDRQTKGERNDVLLLSVLLTLLLTLVCCDYCCWCCCRSMVAADTATKPINWAVGRTVVDGDELGAGALSLLRLSLPWCTGSLSRKQTNKQVRSFLSLVGRGCGSTMMTMARKWKTKKSNGRNKMKWRGIIRRWKGLEYSQSRIQSCSFV